MTTTNVAAIFMNSERPGVADRIVAANRDMREISSMHKDSHGYYSFRLPAERWPFVDRGSNRAIQGRAWCRNCITLENVQQAFGKAGIKAVTEHATDYGAIMGYGIMSTPGLVVNNEVVVAGRVPHSRRHR